MPFVYKSMKARASVPGQAGTPSITSQASTQVGLSWSAPSFTGGAPLTNYLLEYSINAGSSWSTWSHAAGWATSVTVTGLTDYEDYIFRVSAINAVGTGLASASSATASQYNSATGGTLTTPNIGGFNYRVHQYTGTCNIVVNRAVTNFTCFVGAGGAGGGYGAGGGRGYSTEGDYALATGTIAVTVGAAVGGGYNEVTNRDAPGSNGNPSSIGAYVSASGAASRGAVVGNGPTTNITGSARTYGGSGGAAVINNNQNSGGYPGGGTGGSTGNPANDTMGGGGGCQWTSGGGARGEVIIRYRVK